MEFSRFKEITNYDGIRKVYLGKENGEKIKYTIEKNSIEAKRLATISKKIQTSNTNLPLQKIISQKGKTTKQEFIEGQEIKKLNNKIIKDIANITSKLHKIRPPRVSKVGKRILIKKYKKAIKNLEKHKFFSKEEVIKINKRLSNFKKGKFSICHNDITLKNILVNKNKTYLIDVGDIIVGFYEYEIAKLFITLELNEKQKQLFLKEYQKYNDLSSYLKNKQFWNTLAGIIKLNNIFNKYLKTNETYQLKRCNKIKQKMTL
ncbi:MAG: phosphotransferase [Candidatus Woesearchaeota archaeon]